MFSKRRRAASNPAQRAPPSASASLAATKAFVKDRESNPNLSNAAAAAALRTHVATPVSVGDTVTKRMIRRNSVSSNGSSSRAPPGPLRRQSSSGSMTERTFRSPSPGRGSPAEPNAPPVPPVPENIPANGVHRRASSLEPPPYRVSSPNSRGGGRGVSLDRGAQTTVGRGQRASNSLAQVSEEENAASRSVNFSRPMSPGASPIAQNASPQSGRGWFGGPVVNQAAVQQMTPTSRPKSSGGVSGFDLHTAQHGVQNAANRPVKTHQISRGVEGSRLSSGSMRAKPTGTAVQSRSFLQPAPQRISRPVDPNSPDAIYDPSTRSFIHRQDAMDRHREMHQEPPSQQYVTQHVDDYHPQHVTHHQDSEPAPVQFQHIQHEAPRTPQRSEDPVPARNDTTQRTSQPRETPVPSFVPQPSPSAVLPRRNSEDFADADIHVPEQTRSSQVLDVSIPTTSDDIPETIASPKLAANQDSPYPRIVTPVSSTMPKPTVEESRAPVRTTHERQTSLSPPRNAHFAPVAVELAGVKHQPPPRSISPAKSALKASPSVSRRGSSPVSPNGRLQSRGAASEASDTASEDGLKKRKQTRVSFEEKAIIAGSSAYADAESPTSPTGLGASKWGPSTTEQTDEFTDFMKPRSALPSFSSIRSKDRRSSQDDIAEKVTETVSSTPMSASVGSIAEPMHTSSDHLVGGILAQDFAHKQSASNDPLPPEVTSVEGSGYVSDSSSDDDLTLQKHEDAREEFHALPVPEPKTLTTPLDEKSSTPSSTLERVIDVPEIALLPATPSPFEKPEPKFQSMMIPGGWDDEALDQGDSITPTESTKEVLPTSTTLDALTQKSEPVSQIDDGDTTDDNSSIYSDANEDFSDGEGFGSIDAMVAPVSSGLMYSRYADKTATESPPSKLHIQTSADVQDDSDTTPTAEWDATRQHWSGITAAQKQPKPSEAKIEQVPRSTNIDARVAEVPTPQTPALIEPRAVAETVPRDAPPKVTQSPAKPLKSVLKKTPVVQSVQPAEPPIRQPTRETAPRQDPTSVPQMRKSMRASAGPTLRSETQMRSSMRSAPDTNSRTVPSMRKSMRSDELPSPAPSSNLGLAASRHSMTPIDSKPPRGTLQKKHIPAAAVVPAPRQRPQSMPAAKTRAAPVPTYDSDSDASASSFQRSRPRGNRNQGTRYTMRGSMRNDPAPTMRTTAPAPVKQVRSISPPAPAPAIRKSMRPSSPTPEPVKASKFSIRSLSPMGRFRSSKAFDAGPPSPVLPKKAPTFSKAPNPTKPKAAAPFRSRFADSSDDDDDLPRRFQSRFADSDDDEPSDYQLPPGLAPVRGIPRRAGEEDGDSTDLEEEVEYEKVTSAPAPASKATPATNGTNGVAKLDGTTLVTGSLADSKHAPALPTFEAGSKSKTKRGFFGLGKKKTVPTKTAPTQPEPTPIPEPHIDIPLPPTQQNRQPGGGAGPLTPIDEDKDITTPVTPSPQTKKSPKLQRRITPEWPLATPPAIGTEERPMSSDGIAPRRPRFTNRQSSVLSNNTAPIVDGEGRTVSYGRSGKKKKFQGLRRVFGLND
ncbi:hypothetical protein IQ07DRAFT_649799 [Pyrenochaeta sp. DS3sAY3a]|nr:hypothetical protein IQ07DRAFT_649799 [Pyrenochaeta sp. DS3sAY3a]